MAKNKHKRTLIALAVLLVVAAIAGMAWLRFGRAVSVPVAQAVQASVPQSVVGPGTVQARIPVTVAARITAGVREVHADVGDTVKRGQSLALLDDRDLAARRAVVGGQQAALARNLDAARAATAKAEAELGLARSKQQRDAKLLASGFVSQAVVDASDAALRAAAANLDNLRAAQAAREADLATLGQEGRYSEAVLSYSRIVAPMDGIIIARLAEVGNTATPGAALFRMVDPASLWVAARIDESVLSRVQIGQAASIRLRTGEVMPGKVARIARQSDAATREIEVDVAFDRAPAHFAIDQEAEVSIAVGDATGIVVPASALLRDRDGRPGALVVHDGRARFRTLRTGASDGGRVLVLSGLSAGESVVVQPDGVRDGMRVSPAGAPAR